MAAGVMKVQHRRLPLFANEHHYLSCNFPINKSDFSFKLAYAVQTAQFACFNSRHLLSATIYKCLLLWLYGRE